MSDVEVVETPFSSRKAFFQWRDFHRAIRYFAVGFIGSPCRQRRLFDNAARIQRVQGLAAPFLLLRIYKHADLERSTPPSRESPWYGCTYKKP
jgi:hypothetical protein